MSRSQLHSEADLVQRCRKGEREAQFLLYHRYSKAMLNTANRILNSEEEAKDVLQEAFYKAFSKLDRYKAQSTFGAWLKRIVINESISHLKKMRKIDWEDLDRIPEPQGERVSDLGDDFPVSAAQARAALLQLPSGYRSILSLYLVEGYDHKEIAQILGISLNTSLSQYHRGKKKLKLLLEKEHKYGQG